MVIDVDNILTEVEEDCDGTDLKFKCPFCRKNVDYEGGCPHFVFSYEMVNFDYIILDKEFKREALKQLRGQGYKLRKLPCPLEPWAEDSSGNEMPAMHKLIPGLKLTGYCYSAPYGHGSWGLVVGFEQKKKQI